MLSLLRRAAPAVVVASALAGASAALATQVNPRSFPPTTTAKSF
jgi:hypothetical protein